MQVEERLGAAIFARVSKQLDIFLTNERVLADFQNAKEDLFFFFTCEMRRMGKTRKGKEVMLSVNGRIGEVILV